MSRRKLEELAAKVEEEECGDACTLNAGVGVALQIARMAEVPYTDIRDKLFEGEITVEEALNSIKKRLPDDFHTELVEEVEQIMKEKLEETEKQEKKRERPPQKSEQEQKSEAFCFISSLKQKDMVKDLDAMIKDRQRAVESLDPNSAFAKGTEELIEKLKESRKAVEKLPPCEV